jgi:hypothetical protein
MNEFYKRINKRKENNYEKSFNSNLIINIKGILEYNNILIMKKKRKNKY